MGKAEKRKEIFKRKFKRIVVKIGSGVITEPEGGLREDNIEWICEEVVSLKKKNKDIILVSSGAVACGMSIMGLKRRPSEIPKKQALAAIGQAHLIRTYEKFFNKLGYAVGQILLTRDDLEHRRRYLNAKNTIVSLLAMDVFPIVNENDSVMVEEIKFGDNDRLSALVALMMEVDLLIMLSTVDGLYTRDPAKDPNAELIDVVDCSSDIPQIECKLEGSSFWGTGGMESKVLAATQAAMGGIPVVIVKGQRGSISAAVEGDFRGTVFIPKREKMVGKKRWLAFATTPSGRIVIDDGAYIAISKRGKSLLPSGIIDVVGRFDMGDVVSCITPDGREVARGMVNYSSEEIRKIKGLKSYDIEKVLGYKNTDEVIHRDNLVVCEGLTEKNLVGR